MSADAALLADDRHCEALLRHYENFTVASRLTPRELRRDLTRVYAFARTTDDIGDETGDALIATRRLEQWRRQVAAMFRGDAPAGPVLRALAVTVRRHALEEQPFQDLISANLMDQSVSQYEDWPSLHAYCRLSASPVGRIVLRLFGVRDGDADALSDDVCVGLQLANFAQDVSVDAARGRTYLLQQELRALGPRGAIQAMCRRAHDLLQSGRDLERVVPRRLRAQLALYRLGGESIINAIERAGWDTCRVRPVLGLQQRARIVVRALPAVMVALRPEPVPSHG